MLTFVTFSTIKCAHGDVLPTALDAICVVIISDVRSAVFVSNERQVTRRIVAAMMTVTMIMPMTTDRVVVVRTRATRLPTTIAFLPMSAHSVPYRLPTKTVVALRRHVAQNHRYCGHWDLQHLLESTIACLEPTNNNFHGLMPLYLRSRTTAEAMTWLRH
jgi:hypothetical protein